MAEEDRVAFRVNGRAVEVDAGGDVPLLAVLRNDLGLKGSRYGCGLELCGACTVLVDGEPAYSCSRPAWSVAGRDVVTVEGLSEVGDPLIAAFVAEQAGQCGYCLSGILVRSRALLDRNPRPDRAAVIEALDGNLCRCGAHNRIVAAVLRAADAGMAVP